MSVKVHESMIGGVGMFGGHQVTVEVAKILGFVSDKIGETSPSVEAVTEAMHKVEKDRLAFASAEVSQSAGPRLTPGKDQGNNPSRS